MLGKTTLMMREYVRLAIVASATCATGCAQLFDLDWDSFQASAGSGIGGMAAGSSGAGSSSTGSAGAGGAGGECQGTGGVGGTGKSCDGGFNGDCIMKIGGCCDNHLVPAGIDADCGEINPFYLDAYEVTVGRFKRYLVAIDGHALAAAPTGWVGTWEPNPTDLETALKTCANSMWGAINDNLPVNCVTWAEADAFCKWDDGRLPTVGELRRAAKGCHGGIYPWVGLSLDADHATFVPLSIRDVGTPQMGMGEFGQFDLVGNVREWVQFDATCAGEPFTIDTPGQTTFGGSFKSEALNLDIDKSIFPQLPYDRRPETGFRCAR